jgi:hypothetical protein
VRRVILHTHNANRTILGGNDGVIFRGKSQCPLCGAVIREDDEVVAFPEFLQSHHEFVLFSGAAFHRECFERDPRSIRVNELYGRYRKIWDSRPQELKTLEEMEA